MLPLAAAPLALWAEPKAVSILGFNILTLK
jgi:hypothetical protein